MKWHGKKVLVTGAGGFIGSHLVESLVELGADVRALIRYNSAGTKGWLSISNMKDHFEVFPGDIRDIESISRAVKGIDTVFHLAALIAIPYSYLAPGSYVQTNVVGTFNLLQASRDSDVATVVHTSTSEVYGTAQRVPIDESHPLQAQSPYSASKIAADKLSEAFWRSFGLKVVIIRPFNTYGPRQSARAVIPTIISQVLKKDEVYLGRLDPTRDLTYVTDTVRGLIRGAEVPELAGEVINLGTGKEISIGDLAQLIVSQIGKNVPIRSDDARLRPDQSEVYRLCSDNTKARNLMEWKPLVTLEQGLTQTIQWIQENLKGFHAEEYSV
jgi:NAD dependent epimerase/dehydratase